MELTVEIDRWPLIRPFRIAYHTFTQRDLLRVELHQDGVIGRGEAGGHPQLEAVETGRQRLLDLRKEIIGGLSREELLQEVYCRLLENRGRVLLDCRADSLPAAAAYLRRVAASAAVDRLRLLAAVKRGRHLQVRLRNLDRGRWSGSFIAESPGPEARLLARERRRRAFARGRRLAGGRTPRRDVSVLFLAYCRGLSSREIARRLGGGMTPARVDSLMHRLRRRLASRGIRIPRR